MIYPENYCPAKTDGYNTHCEYDTVIDMTVELMVRAKWRGAPRGLFYPYPCSGEIRLPYPRTAQV
jgi:hypothetical protein